MNIYGLDVSDEVINDIHNKLKEIHIFFTTIANQEFLNGNKGVGQKFNELSLFYYFLTDQLEILKQNIPYWHLTSEHPPLDNKYILGYWLNDNGEYDIDIFKYVNQKYKHFGDTIKEKRIIAWMYLPDKFQK